MSASVADRLRAGYAIAESGCWVWKRSLNSWFIKQQWAAS